MPSGVNDMVTAPPALRIGDPHVSVNVIGQIEARPQP